MKAYNDDVTNELISYYLKKKRKQYRLTGKELAILLNVSQQQISRYENGNCQITIDKLNQFLKIFGISWTNFIFEVTKD